MISPRNLLKTTAPTQDMMITTSQKNFLRGENFSRPAKNGKGSSFFWKLKVSELFELFRRFTYEVPSIETGLLGELNPMFL